MLTRLIMVEGIPGSGKTTMAGRIAAHYQRAGQAVALYREGEAHPADMAWNAYVPLREMDGLLSRYPGQAEEILSVARRYNGHMIIPYIGIRAEDRSFYAEMERYEVYDARVPFATFCRLHHDRWYDFAQQAAGEGRLTVFESAFLQNHVNELMLFQLADEDAILAHLKTLLDAVEVLSPVVIYLSQWDVRATIERAARERVSNEGSWIDRVVPYIEQTPYGRRHGLKGMDGFIRAMTARREIELAALETLPVRSMILENPDFDWEAVWVELLPMLSALG